MPLSIQEKSSAARYAWGLELGRRWRDRIRSKRKGQRVVSWQLDEIPHEISGKGGARLRVYIRGVLKGVSEGRPQLGDKLLDRLDVDLFVDDLVLIQKALRDPAVRAPR